MRMLNSQQMKAIDQLAIEELGIPALVLMENAGKATADWIAEKVKDMPPNQVKVLVVCGSGNNAGDGVVTARYLYKSGFQVTVFLCATVTNYSQAMQQQLSIIKKMLILAKNTRQNAVDKKQNILEIKQVTADNLLNNYEYISQYDVIIEALLGTGSRGHLRAEYAQVLQAINRVRVGAETARRPIVIAIDQPAGVIDDAGQVSEATLEADYTLCLAYYKQALTQYPARSYVGEVHVLDIGIPDILLQHTNISSETSSYLLTRELLLERDFLNQRTANSHKGTYGSVYALVGSVQYIGAGILACNASLHAGTGLVYWAAPQQLHKVWAGNHSELILVERTQLNQHIKAGKKGALLLGCGFGDDEQAISLAEELLQTNPQLPVVIDAEAFLQINGDNYTKNTVVTPHPGELATKLSVTVADIENNRIQIARDFAQKYQVTIVLKGASTVISNSCGQVIVNTTGSHLLAKAGNGDVLAGWIAGLLAQGLSPLNAGALAVFCQGKAAQLLANSSYISTMANQLSAMFGEVLLKEGLVNERER